jgi:hypothetical protein
VLHGCDGDVLWLQRDFGVYLVNVFDTGQGSRLLNLPSFGLAHLLQARTLPPPHTHAHDHRRHQHHHHALLTRPSFVPLTCPAYPSLLRASYLPCLPVPPPCLLPAPLTRPSSIQVHAGVTADKQYQTADWRERPLPPALLK